MKKRVGTFVLAVCMLGALSVPAYAAEVDAVSAEAVVVSMDDMQIPVASITGATVNKQSVGNNIYEFELGQQIDTAVIDGQEEIVCQTTKVIAVGEEEAQKVEGNIRKIQAARGTTDSTVSGRYLGGSVTIQTSIYIATSVHSDTTYYKMTKLTPTVTIHNGKVTYKHVKVNFIAKGYDKNGQFVTRQKDVPFNSLTPSFAATPSEWIEIRESYNGDLGGIYTCALTQNGTTTNVTQANYYF